jgi:hypothetical protein
MDDNIKNKIIDFIINNESLNIEYIDDEIERRIYDIVLDILINTSLKTHFYIMFKKIIRLFL